MKHLKKFNEDNEWVGPEETFIYNSDWNLNFFDYRGIKMVDGEKYEVYSMHKQDYEGWKIISGRMEEKTDGIARYSFGISPRQYKQLKTYLK